MLYRIEPSARRRRHGDQNTQALLADARRGSAASREALFVSQLAWIIRRFERELPRCLCGKCDVEDLVQDAFFRAWLGFSAFEGHSIAAYRCWLKQICQHCLAAQVERYITASCREVSREVPLDERAIDDCIQRRFARGRCGEYSPEAALEESEEAERLLAGLPPRARQVVVLHALEERTLPEVAAALGSSVRTVERD